MIIRTITSAFGLAAALTPAFCQAQFNFEWARVMDGGLGTGDYVTNMVSDPQGNVYTVGTINRSGNDRDADIAVYKFDAAGNQVWRRTYDGPDHWQDMGYDLALSSDGYVYVAGRVMAPGTSSDMATLKFRSSDGALQWVRLYDGPAHSVDQALAVAVDASGNVYVTGEVWNDAEYFSNGDYCTLKYDPAGNLLWGRLYDGPATYIAFSDVARNIAVDGNGDVIVSGDSPGTSNVDDIATVKYRGSDGAQLWAQRYTGAGANDNSYTLKIAPNGDAIVGGNTYQSDYKIVLLRYDSVTGAQVWERVDVFPHHGQLVPHSMALDAEGNPIISLTYDPDFDESNLNFNIQTTKYSFQTGFRIWSVSYGNSDRYDAQGAGPVAVDRNGDVIVAGSNLVISEFHTRLALWHYRGSDGTLLAMTERAFPQNSDSPVKVLADGYGNVLAAGLTQNSNSGFSDTFVIKYGLGTFVGPDSFSAFRGIHVSGGLPELQTGDDSRLVVRNDPALSRAEKPIQVVLDGTAPMANPRALAFRFEGQVQLGNLRQTIELWDWTTSSYVVVDNRIGSAGADAMVFVSGIDAGRFIQNGTLAMRAKVSVHPNGPISAGSYTLGIDEAVWIISP